MGEVFVAASCWLVGLAIALGMIVLGHPAVAASSLAVAIVGTLGVRHGASSILVDGLEAAGVAVVGLTIAAASTSVVTIAAASAIAFAAAVQQYVIRVYAHVERKQARASIGVAAIAGFAVSFFVPAVLVAVALWALAEAAWTAIAGGLAIWRREDVRHQVLPPLYGRARWRRLGEGVAASRDTAFWGLIVARPIARALLQLVVEWRALTPNRITAASVVCAFGAATLIVADRSIPLAIGLIAARSVLDSMDGQLARYRSCGSNLGSYVDKASDLFCWGALFAALGIRAFAATEAPAMLVMPLAAAIALALLGMALWLVRALVPAQPFVAPLPAPWVKNLWRIVLFEEPDFYLWIALAVVTARFDVFVPLVAAAYATRAVVLAVARVGHVRSALKETLA